MPPLETDPEVRGEPMERMEYRVMLEIQNLCEMIKRLIAERLAQYREQSPAPAAAAAGGRPRALEAGGAAEAGREATSSRRRRRGRNPE